MTSIMPFQTDKCPHCGMIHQTTCPRIKAIEYENGMIKRIEFHSPVAPVIPTGIDPYAPPFTVTCGDLTLQSGGTK